MKYTNADIKRDIDWDTHDAWGSVQSALFDLSDAWYMSTGNYILGYEPSAFFRENDFTGASERAKMWAGFIRQGDMTTYQVTYWYTVLATLRSWVKLAGREY